MAGRVIENELKKEPIQLREMKLDSVNLITRRLMFKIKLFPRL